MRIQRTALAASALRRSSRCLPNHAWLGEEEPNSLFCLQPRATGLPDKAKGCRSGWGDSTLCSTPTAAQQSPSVTFPQPRNPRVLSSTHICADSDWSWGCSIALGEMDGDPNPSPFSGWKLDSWQWGCTGKASVLRETQIYGEKIDSMQKKRAALNETCSQLNLCGGRFDVNHLSLRLLRKLSAIHHVFSSHPGTCCLHVVFLSPCQRLLSEKASPICPFQQSEDISHCIFSAINIFMSSFISWWGMEGVHSLGRRIRYGRVIRGWRGRIESGATSSEILHFSESPRYRLMGGQDKIRYSCLLGLFHQFVDKSQWLETWA